MSREGQVLDNKMGCQIMGCYTVLLAAHTVAVSAKLLRPVIFFIIMNGLFLKKIRVKSPFSKPILGSLRESWSVGVSHSPVNTYTWKQKQDILTVSTIKEEVYEGKALQCTSIALSSSNMSCLKASQARSSGRKPVIRNNQWIKINCVSFTLTYCLLIVQL